jgi:hypothetical protein
VTYPEPVDVLVRLATRAVELPDLAEVTRARLLAQLATMNADAGHGQHARDQTVRALATAQREGDPLAMVDAARARALTLVGAHDAEERLRLGDLVVRHATALGQPVGVVMGHEWRLRAGYELARLSVVEDALGAIAVLAERVGLPLVQWHHQRVIAAVAALEGRFDAARSANAQAYEIAIETGDATGALLVGTHAHRISQLRGDLADIPPGIERVLERTDRTPVFLVARAQWHLQTGRPDEARAWYERLVAVLNDPPTADLRWTAVALDMVELSRRSGTLRPPRRCFRTSSVTTTAPAFSACRPSTSPGRPGASWETSWPSSGASTTPSPSYGPRSPSTPRSELDPTSSPAASIWPEP